MDVWRYYQPNPKKRNTGDCSVRAISKALGVDWETAYILTADAGLIMADMPDNNGVIGGRLQRNGFRRAVVPNTCPDCYTFRDDSYSEDDGYSRHDYGGGRDQLAGKLRRMLGDAPDEKSRNAIMNALNTIEK